MAELKIKIPDELNGLTSASNIKWQLAVERKLKEELEYLAKLKRIVDKSKLTEKQAKELSDEVNWSLAKRYEETSRGK